MQVIIQILYHYAEIIVLTTKCSYTLKVNSLSMYIHISVMFCIIHAIIHLETLGVFVFIKKTSIVDLGLRYF